MDAFITTLGFAFGLVTTLLLSLLVAPVLRQVAPNKLTPPKGLTEEAWELVTSSGPESAKPLRLLGVLESLFFFCTFWFSAWILTAGWLAFKVGSKWETWQSIVKVPEALPASYGVDFLEYLGAKNRWASRMLQRWLLGVLLNASAAACGLAAARLVSGALMALLACLSNG